MSSVRRAPSTPLFVMVALAAACADSPSGPHGDGPSAPFLELDPAMGAMVDVLERGTPLAVDEVVEETIGSSGGTITLPKSGLTLVVPPGALLAPETIRVVAPAGDLVGYDLFPHGLTFAVPILATQDLRLTRISIPAVNQDSNLVGAFFEGALRPRITALEVAPLDVQGAAGTFPIHHFSGYVVATN